MDAEAKGQAEQNKKIEETNEQALQEKKANRSKFWTSSVCMAADTIGTLHSKGKLLDFSTVLGQLIDSAKMILNGNTNESEQILMMQAKTLDYVFYDTLNKLTDCQMINHVEVYMNIAFRAQNQARKTLLALAELKSPHRATFIKQQNNAVNQQVNNGEKPKSKKNKKVSNELLSEINHETLDFRGTSETIPVNSTVEAVAICRSKNTRRQSHKQNECI